MSNPYQTRLDEFGEAYEGFEGDALCQLVQKAGGLLERVLMEPKAVDVAMRALHKAIYGATYGEWVDRTPWREIWEGETSGDTPVGCQFMVALHAFAFYGLPPELSFFGIAEDEGVPAAMARFVRRGRELIDCIPKEWEASSELYDTVKAAEARLSLDFGEDVSPEQLAALARLSIKSVRNLLTPKAGEATGLQINGQGKIAADVALSWLATRSDFLSSVWQQGAPVFNRVVEDETCFDDVVFVPIAKDGSAFDPVTCLRNGVYSVGPKGREEQVPDYKQALERLARMATPYWRRPNEAGNWGLVAGVSWARKRFHDGQLKSVRD